MILVRSTSGMHNSEASRRRRGKSESTMRGWAEEHGLVERMGAGLGRLAVRAVHVFGPRLKLSAPRGIQALAQFRCPSLRQRAPVEERRQSRRKAGNGNVLSRH